MEFYPLITRIESQMNTDKHKSCRDTMLVSQKKVQMCFGVDYEPQTLRLYPVAFPKCWAVMFFKNFGLHPKLNSLHAFSVNGRGHQFSKFQHLNGTQVCVPYGYCEKLL